MTSVQAQEGHLLRCIGNTPLLKLQRVVSTEAATIYAKAEFLNPGGSVKDRIARYIIEQAEQRGELKPGSTILEVTSGNTGIALAMVGAQKGYRVRILMPATASEERKQMIRSFGADLELIRDIDEIQAAVAETEERARKDPSIYLPRQFQNPDNPAAHRATTGREIVEQAGPDVDGFVTGVGTGGTLMGVAAALREVNPNVLMVAVEPKESAVLSGASAGAHGIQGIGDGFIPAIVETSQIDLIVRVSTGEAEAMARRLALEEGLLVGVSAGANVVAAIQIAKDLGPEKKIVTILPDRGERYLSVW